MSSVPQANWPANPQSSGSSWVPAMLVGAVIFAVGCGSGFVAGWLSGSANTFGGVFNNFATSADFTLEVEHPETVALGQPFEIVVRVTDTRGEERQIRDIDFYGSICDDFTFGTISPPVEDSTRSPEYREHTFNRTLAAFATEEFRFTLTPTVAGAFADAEITVYDADYNSEYTFLTITVE